MPLCAKCSNPFVCHCSAAVRKQLGAVAESCPLEERPGAIWVHVTDDRGNDVGDVSAGNDGALKPTDANGVAVYDPVAPGEHEVRLSSRTIEKLNLYEVPKKTSRKTRVTSGEITYVAYQLARKPALKVKVVEKGNPAKLFEGATVMVTGQESPPAKPSLATGLSDFGWVAVGDYQVKVELKEDDKKTHATTLDFSKITTNVALAAGHERELIVEAEPLNIVTPKIELEYKVVLLDRKLSAHLDPSEPKIVADATYIEVSATQTRKEHLYAKTGTLEFTPISGGAVEAFFDEACKKPFDKPLNAKALFGGVPTKIWLRGTAAGKFKVKLKLDDPDDRFIRLADDPGEQEMGVVELQLKVHWHVRADIEALADVDPDVEPPDQYNTALSNLALPEQKALTDQQKVVNGRVLHVQSASGEHHDRAKLVIKALVGDQWPAGCDAYKVTLNKIAKTGDIVVFNARAAGAEQQEYSVDVATLKAADVELWLEGKTASKALHDLQLNLGLDRSAGGLPKTAKIHADWARFTTVKIEAVTLDYIQEANADNAWDAAQKRYYININEKADPDGRKIKISAQLSEKILGIPICFMIAPDRNNLLTANWGFDFPANARHFDVAANGAVATAALIQWKDVPVALKHADRPDRKKLLHLGGATDKDGQVKQEVQLSRFGGDKFHPAAYIEQDPHLAKFIEGHPALGLREPVFAKICPVQVWRKMYFESIEPPTNGLPASDGIQTTQRLVFLEPVLTGTKKVAAADYKINPERPAWQFTALAGNSMRLCIGDHNIDDIRSRLTPVTRATSPKLHAFVCDEQFDADTVVTAAKTVVFNNLSAQAVTMEVNGTTDGFSIFDPPLQGGDLVVSATWQMDSFDKNFFTRKTKQNSRHSGVLPAANVTLDSARTGRNMIRVTPPTECGGAAGGCTCGGKPTKFQVDAKHFVWVDIEVQAATGPWGGWAPNNAPPTVVLQRASLTEADNVVQDTFGHELGHKFGQTRHTREPGLPDHPLYYQQRGGSGTHCAFATVFTPDPAVPQLDPSAMTELDAQGNSSGEYSDGTCVLWHSASNWKRNWCKHCALEFSHSDLSTFS